MEKKTCEKTAISDPAYGAASDGSVSDGSASNGSASDGSAFNDLRARPAPGIPSMADFMATFDSMPSLSDLKAANAENPLSSGSLSDGLDRALALRYGSECEDNQARPAPGVPSMADFMATFDGMPFLSDLKAADAANPLSSGSLSDGLVRALALRYGSECEDNEPSVAKEEKKEEEFVVVEDARRKRKKRKLQ